MIKEDSQRRSWFWGVDKAVDAAGESLDRFQQPATYASANRYIATVSPLAAHLTALNASQHWLEFSLAFGVRVHGLDYSSSVSLAAYASRGGLLCELVGYSLSCESSSVDLLVVSVTRIEELLAAMVAVRLLRQRNPRLHACLADHSHEDFTLTHSIASLRNSGSLSAIFDTIIERKAERDTLVVEIARRVHVGETPKGFLSGVAADPPETLEGVESFAAPPHRTFNSQNVLWTRASPGRCYWGKCSFCALNAKHAIDAYPSATDYVATLARLPQIAKCGYSVVNFGDEAISPANLERLACGILDKGIGLRWACCCKLEHAFSPELFRLMRASGCYEVFWGLETISPALLARMNKSVRGLDLLATREILRAASSAEIGTHVSLLAGFPGEMPSELIASVDFLLATLPLVRHATFNINEFVLRPGSPAADDPAKYRVRLLPQQGDIAGHLEYDLDAEWKVRSSAVRALVPVHRGRLYRGLGWKAFGNGHDAAAALSLHFFYGHGSIIKQLRTHDFAAPLEVRRRCRFDAAGA